MAVLAPQRCPHQPQSFRHLSTEKWVSSKALKGSALLGVEIDPSSFGEWIKKNMHRTNLILDARLGIEVLTLLEGFVQCRLKPLYEGFESQR